MLKDALVDEGLVHVSAGADGRSSLIFAMLAGRWRYGPKSYDRLEYEPQIGQI